ncbi:MAG: SGNH/GDSL hydrolase family protein [Opitutaceae bacterium]|nr:SGNH/GDSL hydrolase family protein [Cytophagales bacterium]
MPSNPTSQITDKNKTYTYLALGDSYTIGESVSVSDRYPNLIVSELKKENITVTDTIIARTGWTTQNLKTAISNANIDNNKYDIVSLLIGVNNQYQGRSLSEYKVQFKELLETAVKFAKDNKSKVFVISIPDYGYTPSSESNQVEISKEIDSFNAANKNITDSMGIKYFNITPISRGGLKQPELVANDGLHPSGIQYKKWVELMLNDIKQIITK